MKLRLFAAFLLLLNSSTCFAEESDALMALSFEAFDQKPDTGWRTLARTGKCSAAASLIERYARERSGGLSAYEKFSLAFHAGQMYGLAGANDAAVASFESARKAFPNSPNDAYIRAHIAFLQRDVETLARARDEVAALSDANPAKSVQLNAVQALLDYHGCSLAVVGIERPTSGECPRETTPCK